MYVCVCVCGNYVPYANDLLFFFSLQFHGSFMAFLTNKNDIVYLCCVLLLLIFMFRVATEIYIYIYI